MRAEFTISSGSVALVAESDGAGPNIVCLHAGVCDRRMWRALMPFLGSRYRLIAYDRRGFGQTPPVDEAHSDVQDLCAVLDQCAAGAPVVLLGASRGGALALDLVLAHPERVTALVLLAPAVSGDPDDAPLADDLQAWVNELATAERSRDLDRLNALEVHFWLDGPRMPEGRVGGSVRALVLDMNRIALSQPPLTRRLEPPPAYPWLERVARPALVLTGLLDVPDRLALGQQLAARLPRARAHVFEDAAHLPSLEQPERCAELIRSFLDGVASQS